MRILLAIPLLAALAIAPALAQPSPRAAARPAKSAAARPANWAATVTATPQGGLLIGNPAAAVKLVEFGSLTCSHCAAFHAEGLPALKAKYIATGRVSYEFRSFARNGPDFAASLIALCQPAPQALRLVDALFAGQADWTQPFAALSPADSEALARLPVEQQFGRLATLGKLDQWAAARGVPAAKVATCLADKAGMDRLVTTRSQAVQVHGLQGTPTFVLNGKTVDAAYDWAALEPKLAAAARP